MLTPAEVKRYMKLLGVPERKPGLEALKEIVHAHLMLIPFENISKLYRLKTAGFQEFADITMFLDGIEQYHFGGTCYPNNYHLNQLLSALGYDVILCGADMKRPDVHIVNIVSINGNEYLVDTGYAAPFLEPLPLALPEEYRINLGSDSYVLSPKDVNAHSELTLYRDGVEQHGYLVNPKPRSIEEFRKVITESFRPEATFMNNLLLARFCAGCAVVIRNMTCIKIKNSTVKRMSAGTMDELVSAIEINFSIPRSVSTVALDGIEFLTLI